ncbi:MAG: GSU2403 family nucleotidyltransferase fold protein [Candidatus Eremiobacteraeota bacterium]|nr:GSU2403 family nucleotidyltransferase fold protein [Candidatus Eremiobacteraeota bacterium]
MSEQIELVYKMLKSLQEAGILGNMIIVGSWCIHFYRHHYRESEVLPPLRTRDIEFDVSFLRHARNKVNVIELLEKLGFLVDFKGSGFTNLESPELIVEFLVPEKGKGSSAPRVISGFGINAQPIRFLNFLEERLIDVSYRDLVVKIPHPAWFAIHKLIISRRRPEHQATKKSNDITQALAVWDMVVAMGEKGELREVLSWIPKGWLKLVKESLVLAQQAERLEDMQVQSPR